jgi:hypothetical protein
VKDFWPLGHSGQDKLQTVVGSIEILKGYPKINGILNITDK